MGQRDQYELLREYLGEVENCIDEIENNNKTRSVVPDSNNKGSNWRQPTDQECEEIRQWFVDEFGYSYDFEAKSHIEEMYCIVQERFKSDSPGYAGRVIFAIFGYPEAHIVWSYNQEGNLTQVESMNQ